jgi:hypothetical protein
MSTSNDFRAAAGLRRWPPADDPPAPAPGPGLFEVSRDGGDRAITNVRRIAGADRAPGSVLIGWAAWLLALIGSGALYVSFSAQRQYVFGARHQNAAAIIEALLLDVLLIVFTLLALGLSRAGKSSRTERALILACAIASAWMNVSDADTASPRSVVAYAVAPVALAVVVDRVVSVIRRHVLGVDEVSAWTALGRAAVAAARLAALAALYSLRFALAPLPTAKGLRRWVLVVTPLPEAGHPELPATEEARAIEPPPVTEPPELEGASKKARLAWWYRQDPDYGKREAIGPLASKLGPKVGLGAGTARAYLGAFLADLERKGGTS